MSALLPRLWGWVRRLRGPPPPLPRTAVAHSAQIAALLDEAQRLGEVHPRGADIAKRALAFGELLVSEVMVPRHRIQAIACDAPMPEIRRILLEEGHACMPVYRQTLDHVVGILVVKDMLTLAWEQQLVVFDDLLQPPYFAPEIMRAADLLKELQHRRQHFAVVVNELGGTAGIVTIEDLLEELVGDIVGDHDAEAPKPIHFDEGGVACCEGSMPIRELNRELQLDLDEGEAWSTLGGLCTALAGGIPQVGQTLRTSKGTALHIVDACERRVRLVRLETLAGGGQHAVGASL